MFNPLAKSSAPTALVVKGTGRHMDGSTGVAPYEVGSCGSELSCLRSRFVRAMEGLHQSKGAPKLKDVKSLQGAGHVSRTQTCLHDCPDGPLAMEASLHIEAWRTKCPKRGQQCSLEFEVQYACVMGVCLNMSEFVHYLWDMNSNWRDFVQMTDLIAT